MTGRCFPLCSEYGRLGLGLVATFALTAAGALVLIAAGSAVVFGWDGYAMRSDSMSPAIRRGDVLLAVTPPRGRSLGDGTVVVFSDADHRTIAHRIVGRGAAGEYTTRGDHNPVADSDPLPPGQIHGIGRLLVPYVGLPYVWWEEGRRAYLVYLGVLLMLCAWMTRFALPDARASLVGGDA